MDDGPAKTGAGDWIGTEAVGETWVDDGLAMTGAGDWIEAEGVDETWLDDGPATAGAGVCGTRPTKMRCAFLPICRLLHSGQSVFLW